MGDVATLKCDRPRGRLQQSSQQARRRALAPSGFTNDRELLLLPNREVHAIDRLDSTDLPPKKSGTDREVLDQPFNADHVAVLLGTFRRGLTQARGHSRGAISSAQTCARSVWDKWQATKWPGSMGVNSGRDSSLRPPLRAA